MAAVDAQYCFTFVDIGALGSESDGGVFGRSLFGKSLRNGTLNLPDNTCLPGTEVLSPYTFIADEAFPLCENLMRPFPGRELTIERRVYNYRHCRARRVVENAFGILAARWRIFGTRIEGAYNYYKCSTSNTAISFQKLKLL